MSDFCSGQAAEGQPGTSVTCILKFNSALETDDPNGGLVWDKKPGDDQFTLNTASSGLYAGINATVEGEISSDLQFLKSFGLSQAQAASMGGGIEAKALAADKTGESRLGITFGYVREGDKAYDAEKGIMGLCRPTFYSGLAIFIDSFVWKTKTDTRSDTNAGARSRRGGEIQEGTVDDFIGSYKPAVGRKYAEGTLTFKQISGQIFPVDPTLEVEKINGESLHDFFGTNKKSVKKFGASPVVYYDFEPGPFTLAFVEALKDLDQDVVMLIEEINRGNCAAIFGDVFQLLDRDKDGEGEYSISIGSEWGSWLKKTLKDIDDETKKKYFPYSDNQYKICLPSNLYLLATMNTADQGLFPMDSAFKRRWFMKYIGMNHAEDSKLHFKVPVQIGKEKEWEKFRDKINEKILEYTKNPDKRLGPFFVKESEFKVSEEIRAEFFFSKVIYYVWSVLKPAQREKVFVKVESTTSLDDLEKRYFNKEEVFQKTVFE